MTIVARDPGRLEAAEKELKVRPSTCCSSDEAGLDWADEESISRPGQIIQAIPADLTQSSTSTEALEKAAVAHGGKTPDHVYLCAGSSRPKFMLDSTEEEFKGVHPLHLLFMR